MHSSMIGSAVTYLGIAAIRGGDVSSQVYVLADVSFLPSECTIQHCAQTVKADCARCCMMHADVPDQAALVHSALGMSTGKELKRWTVCDQHAALLIGVCQQCTMIQNPLTLFLLLHCLETRL